MLKAKKNRGKTGVWMGVPYDWRRPTRARVRSRFWNPKDRRLFTPKSYGWGYDINLAEVRRRLGFRPKSS